MTRQLPYTIDLALAGSSIAAAVVDTTAAIAWQNKSFQSNFGCASSTNLSRLWSSIDDNLERLLQLNDCLANGAPWTGPIVWWRGHRELHFDVDCSPVSDNVFLLLAYNVTKHHQVLGHVMKAANFDHLTGLGNRNLFNEFMSSSVRTATRSCTESALLFIDLDGFKQINDQHGHELGDYVLRRSADRIKRHIRESDFCARLGGDEFACILSNLTSPMDAIAVAEKIIESVSEPIPSTAGTLRVGASIGIAQIGRSPGVSPDEIVHSADMAMYNAKRAGKGCCRLADNVPPPAIAAFEERQKEFSRIIALVTA